MARYIVKRIAMEQRTLLNCECVQMYLNYTFAMFRAGPTLFKHILAVFVSYRSDGSCVVLLT